MRPGSEPRRAGLPALLSILALVLGLAGCAEQSCGSVAVLDALDASDHQADLSHLGLVRDAVVTAPGPTPDSASCSIWEQVRGPAPDQVLLRAQYYGVRRVSTGWELSP